MFSLKPQSISEEDSDRIMQQFFDWERQYVEMRQELNKTQEVYQWENYFLREA